MISLAYVNGARAALNKLGMLPAPKGPDISKSEARQVAQKLKVPSRYPTESFREGVETELEHTKDPYFAGKISLDHLKESPRYYTELKKMEAKL
jgi:hypothetical protein